MRFEQLRLPENATTSAVAPTPESDDHAMDSPVNLVIRMLRVVLVAVLALCLWNAAQARADTVEHLMVPSAGHHAAMIGYCDQAQGSNRTLYVHYRTIGGHKAHMDVSADGQHD